jgi:hypothetical protein
MQLNKDCYRFEIIKFNNGLFNESIDATYILHLENNGRIDNIYEQLNKYHLTNTVYILYNKGYKKCNKKSYIKSTLYDIVDANLEIFKHSYNNNYNNILILEDDFIFDNQILDKFHINNINQFILNKPNENYIYHLGCTPLLYCPYDIYNNLGVFVTGLHAAVFTKKFREIFFLDNHSGISDWDVYMNLKSKRYFYFKPLCYQTYNETENSKNYPDYFGLSFIFRKIVIILKLDTEPIDGFKLVYHLSKYLSIIVLFFILILFFYIFFYIIKFYKFKLKI